MKLLDDYFKLQKEIYDHFGYVEDWVVIPIEDATEMFWMLDEQADRVRFAPEREILDTGGDYFETFIYKQRFLPKWVYPADDYTMICVDTQTDGNKFLQVFDNAKRISAPAAATCGAGNKGGRGWLNQFPCAAFALVVLALTGLVVLFEVMVN